MIYNIQGQFESIFQYLWHECENGEDNCDVVLIAGDNGLRIAAHRLILAATSEYFRTMFRSKMLESTSKEIKIPTISGNILYIIIQSIYTGRVDINADNANELLQAAHLLLLTKVVDACGDYLIKELHPSNCFGFLFLAEQYQCQTILQNAKSCCLKNFVAASQTEEFLKCSADQLSEMLASEELCANSEEDVFNSVKKWICHNPTKREEKYKAAMLKLVRLQLLKHSFLIEQVKPFCRTSAECFEIYMEVLEQSLLSYPNCNSTNRKNSALLMAFKIENSKIEIKYYCATRSKWMKYVYSSNAGNRYAYTFCVMKDNLYMIGGYDDNNEPITYINLKMLTLNTTNPMETKRACCRTVELRGFLYVVGGHNTISGNSLSSVEKFNPKTNTWSTVAPMSVARSSFAIAVLNDKLYVAGGLSYRTYNNAIRTGSEYFNLAECYDPEKNIWISIKSMNRGLGDCQAAVANGLLYVIGDARNENQYKFVERYDPQTNCWTMICSLKTTAYCLFQSSTHCDKVLVYYENKILEYNAEKDEWVLSATPSVGSIDNLFSYSGALLKSKFTEDE